jgi:hypothetical protein
LTVFKGGKIREQVLVILKLIAESDAILGTRHLSPKEIMALIPVARDVGVLKILITHPEHPHVDLPPAQQEELRDRYQVFFERCLVTTVFGGGPSPFEILVEAIHRVGFESTIISTDFGQLRNPSPVDGLACFITGLRQNGFTEAEIIRMSRQNPAHLLGLAQ